MLSPLREPVYAASARTLSGSLAEMERIIGETLFSGYVGYNGRAPGSAAKKEELSESGERNKSGGDARHTLVAYFEIVELASILCVDRETANLAIRTFRHTANNTSLRNRNVESLATAAFVSASERRWLEYQEWLKEKNVTVSGDGEHATDNSDDGTRTSPSKEWPTPPRHLTIEEISTAANLDANEVLRYLKVVHVALRKQRPENSSSITAHMPTFCRRLDLPERTRKLANGIAEKAMQNNICSRRNPPSISAAAIYLACQLDGVRKTQMEICRATPVTEVTLRKVRNELVRDQSAVMPDWYNEGESHETGAKSAEGNRPFARLASRRSAEPASQVQGEKQVSQSEEPTESAAKESNDSATVQQKVGVSLVPPPLPPGFGKGQVRPKAVHDDPKPTGPTASQLQVPTPSSNPMLAMLNNPAMQAFANVFAMMPQLSPPPPPAPPPLPSNPDPGNLSHPEGPPSTQVRVETTGSTQPSQKDTGSSEEGSRPGVDSGLSQPQQAPPPIPPQPNGNLMAGMQSMMSMVQAMQAFQAVQNQPAAEHTTVGPAEQLNPLTMMAMAMAQAQNTGGMVSNTGSVPSHSQPSPPQDASQSMPASVAPDSEVQGVKEQTQPEK